MNDTWQKQKQKLWSRKEKRCAAVQFAASFHCLLEQRTNCEELRPSRKTVLFFMEKRSESMKHRAEWYAEADRYRCMRCGRGEYMKTREKCAGLTFLTKSWAKWRRRHLGGHDLHRRTDTHGEVMTWCRKCSGYARQSMGP